MTEHTSPAALVSTLETLETSGEVYLIGGLEARGIAPQPPTVAVSGETVSLAYATPAVIDDWGARPLRDLLITVQVRHAPGDTVPAIELNRDSSSVIPSTIRSWLTEDDINSCHRMGR